jgi:hypothetical protein
LCLQDIPFNESLGNSSVYQYHQSYDTMGLWTAGNTLASKAAAVLQASAAALQGCMN